MIWYKYSCAYKQETDYSMGKLQMPYFNSINNTVIVIQKVFDSLFSAQTCPPQQNVSS